MIYITITKVIEIVWLIKDVENYGFGKDKNLYNLKTNHLIKMTLNGRSKGYWIKKQFYSLNRMKKLLIRPKYYKIPF